jgi:hypothetical protein
MQTGSSSLLDESKCSRYRTTHCLQLGHIELHDMRTCAEEERVPPQAKNRAADSEDLNRPPYKGASQTPGSGAPGLLLVWFYCWTR